MTRRGRVLLAGIATAGLVGLQLVAVTGGSTGAASGSGFTRQIAASGTTTMPVGVSGVDGLQRPEIAGVGGDAGAPAQIGPVVDRSFTSRPGHGPSATSQKTKSNPTLVTSFNGLNHRNQRLANGGNQFSLEPPDQGLCAGNGYVLETLNDVARVYDRSGNPLTGAIDLNSFYGYPAAINRTTGVRGPFITDPSCLFDTATQRWFNVVLTLDVDPATGAFLGTNHLDLAVSTSANPTGSWRVYSLPVQDDGTQGTPNHGCTLDGTTPGPCLGDYPHIGADANGFYITTNEYSFFGPEYKWANLYAFSKQALAANASSVTVVQLGTATSAGGNPGFTVWPAQSPAGQFQTDNGGTEYFMSSDAAAEANGTGSSNRIWAWQLTNTASLGTASPSVTLSTRPVAVGSYAVPPASEQKAGDYPLGQCLNDASCATFLLGGPDPYAPNAESPLDSNDSRMQQVWYANGKLWGALDTAVTVGGENRAGIEWFVVNPSSGKLAKQGYLAVAGNNVTYPAIAVTPSGRGVMAFTLVGRDHYPSAAFASIDALAGVGPVQVAAEGLASIFHAARVEGSGRSPVGGGRVPGRRGYGC